MKNEIANSQLQPSFSEEYSSYISAIKEIISKFDTLPYLFIGSGFSHRYLNTPTWEELLREILNKMIDAKPFAYYKQKAIEEFSNDGLEYVASLIKHDFIESWFNHRITLPSHPVITQVLDENIDPLHAEIADYIQGFDIIDAKFQHECNQFTIACHNHVAGIITTNYDTLIEQLSEFPVFIGQGNMLLNNSMGIGEIYKIHGCVTKPASMVLDSNDYAKFKKQTPYLSAKLLTIFNENPVIFIGYSLSDKDIQSILGSLIDCYTSDDLSLDRLSDKLIFIEYEEGFRGLNIFKTNYHVGDKNLYMTTIKMSDFGILYEGIAAAEKKLPARVLRYLKSQVVDFIKTSKPSRAIRIGNIQDPSIDPNALIMFVGTKKELDERGYIGIGFDEWYINILKGFQTGSADGLIQYTYQALAQSNEKLPACRLLDELTYEIPDYVWIPTSLNDITKRSGQQNKNIHDRSISGIRNLQGKDLSQKCYYIMYLSKEEINIDELESFLLEAIKQQNALRDTLGTRIRTLIRVFDFLKFGQKIKERKV